MKLRFVTLVCMTAIAFMPIPASFAQPLEPSGRILQSLNLSEEQRRQIRDILTRNQDDKVAARTELRAREQELRTMMDGNASRESILQKFSQIQTLRRQNEQRRFQTMLEMREVLTPQQRSQLSQNVNQRRERFRANWQQRRENRNPNF